MSVNKIAGSSKDPFRLSLIEKHGFLADTVYIGGLSETECDTPRHKSCTPGPFNASLHRTAAHVKDGGPGAPPGQ